MVKVGFNWRKVRGVKVQSHLLFLDMNRMIFFMFMLNFDFYILSGGGGRKVGGLIS